MVAACSSSGEPAASDTTEGVADDPAATPPPAAPPAVAAPPVVEAPPAAPATAVPASRAELTRWLEQVLDAAGRAAPGLTLGVLVVDEAGREVVALAPDTPLIPASTLKQVTAAAALTTLGPGARLPTTVEATAGITGDGTLDGDLLLLGSGDPTLVTEEYARMVYPARPRTSLDAVADRLVELGLRRVTGQVRGAAPGFAEPTLPEGWPDRYLDSLDGRYPAGLTVDGGLVTRIELPEVDDGPEGEGSDGPAADPPDAPPDGDTRAAPDDPPTPINVLEQLAALDSDQPPTVRTSLAIDPVQHAAAELTRLLRERGVEVIGSATSEPAELPSTGRLVTAVSPSLADVLRFTVQRSDNHLADALALVVARTRTRDGSWAAVPRAFTQVLERFDVPAEGLVVADGSGLSRADRLTARTLTDLDRRMTDNPRFGATWRSLLSVAGGSGTLRDRYVGTVAEGRLLGKTGTLRDVTSLTGQIISATTDPLAASTVGERRYHLTVLGNGVDGANRAVVRAVMDEVTLALTADLDGCSLARAGEDGPLGQPPVAVRCTSG
ncbi:MAG: D-alanyl-D-alanine carboxypeptidase/D-alanyl-D-alanine-endopeptidase [Nitriliruptor sp.]|uniref:D-alanyl-D-alanine carboxypeptidase/D-alanyl-D-alanine endopeptidase n=1 Tax=Nitriliruptor sp. TaxID=2448056 RepID=UPI0034A024F5